MRECYLFLDIDGVFNSIEHNLIFDKSNWELSKEAIIRFNYVLYYLKLDYNVKIVISSTWRNHHTLSVIKDFFNTSGFNYSYLIVDVTEDLDTKRGIEIKKYVDDKNITNYLIIDDMNEFLDEQLPHFIHVNNICGFSIFDGIRILDYFNCIYDIEFKTALTKTLHTMSV